MSKSEQSDGRMAGARIDEDLHRQLRIRAAEDDKSHSDVIRDALREYLD